MKPLILALALLVGCLALGSVRAARARMATLRADARHDSIWTATEGHEKPLRDWSGWMDRDRRHDTLIDKD